jgi:ERCC4-type nuclease
MFHNIFSKIISKNKKKKIPLIIADIHEKDSLILAELKENPEIELEIRSLKIGDYAIGNAIIERKTTGDFVSSMLNKRLIRQLISMQAYSERLLIIEGNPENLINQESKLNPNAIRGFILSIISNYKTPVIFTLNYSDTANYLIVLAKQQLKAKKEISLHSKIPKTINEQKKYVLEAFPNIGPKKSSLLLKKFKNLSGIFNASEQELNDVLKNHSKEFRNLLDLK